MYKLRFKDDDEVEVGLDEAGRGCLWGPLYVGAVAFSDRLEDFPDGGEMLGLLKDSKVLTKKRRELLYDYITESALGWSVAHVTAEEVDRENAQYLAIAAAGILAKVSRDRWVSAAIAADPSLDARYGFGSNMGYGTAAHLAGLSAHGITPEHRRTFGPVAAVLGLPGRKGKTLGKKGGSGTHGFIVE